MFVKHGGFKISFYFYERLVYTVEVLTEDDSVDLLGIINWSESVRNPIYNI